MYYTIKQRKSRVPLYRLLSIRFKFSDGAWDYSLNIKVKEGSFNSEERKITNDLEATIRLNNLLHIVDKVKLAMYSEEIGTISREGFKSRFLKELSVKGYLSKDESDRSIPLKKQLVEYIEDYISTGLKTSRMKRATSGTYSRLGKISLKFDRNWDVLTTDQSKLKAFRLYLIENGFATATINLMLVRLKTILKNFSKYEKELSTQIINSPYLEKLQEVKKKRVYITLDELNVIFDLKIEDNQMAKARDLFLIGCYTALRVSDWEIRPIDVSADRSKLVYRTQKTGIVVEIPLFDKLKIVLERNGWATPFIQENRINPLFRELVKKAGIIRPFKTLQVYPDRVEENIIEAWEGVTTHTCRRSFATNMYLEGMPVSQIRAYTGHANAKVFMNYVQASDTEVSQQVKLETLNNIFNNEK